MSFLVHFEDALAYKNQRRPVEPPVYNESRLNELPIPEIQPVNNDENAAANETIGIVPNVSNELANQEAREVVFDQNGLQNETNDAENQNGDNDENGTDITCGVGNQNQNLNGTQVNAANAYGIIANVQLQGSDNQVSQYESDSGKNVLH